MNKSVEKPDNKKLDNWVKETLNIAVYNFLETVTIDSAFVEAKPVWVLPFQILIGKIRAKTQPENFTWVICGDLPTDYVNGSVAATPQEAAKHFSLKWQLNASNVQGEGTVKLTSQDGKSDETKNLITQAEALYELVDNQNLWLQQDKL